MPQHFKQLKNWSRLSRITTTCSASTPTCRAIDIIRRAAARCRLLPLLLLPLLLGACGTKEREFPGHTRDQVWKAMVQSAEDPRYADWVVVENQVWRDDAESRLEILRDLRRDVMVPGSGVRREETEWRFSAQVTDGDPPAVEFSTSTITVPAHFWLQAEHFLNEVERRLTGMPLETKAKILAYSGGGESSKLPDRSKPLPVVSTSEVDARAPAEISAPHGVEPMAAAKSSNIAEPAVAASMAPAVQPAMAKSAEPAPTKVIESAAAPSAEPSPQPEEVPTPSQASKPVLPWSGEPAPKAKPEAQPATEPSPQPTSAPAMEPASTREPTPKPISEPMPEPAVQPATEPAPAPEPATEPKSQPTPEPATPPSAEPASTPAPEPSTQPTTEPAPAPAPAPEPATQPAANPAPIPEPTPAPAPAPAAEPKINPTPSHPTEPTPSPEPTPNSDPEPIDVPAPVPDPAVPPPFEPPPDP